MRPSSTFGVICYDRDPSGIVVTDSRRDAGLNDMDSFQMVFDTYRDRQNGFVFGTNPAGIEYDGQVSKEGGGGQTSSRQRTQTGTGSGFNLNWDASFTVRAHIGEMGWMAEFAIPLRSLRYGSGTPQSWGLNFQRNMRRKREQVYWSPVSRIFNLYRLSSAGDLNGLELATPRNFKVTPYALSSANRDFPTSTSSDFDAQIGIDAKIGVTPALNLDVTVNTDFAQVEVDDQQLTLIAKKREQSSAKVLTKEPLGLCLERCFQTKHQTTRGPYSALETISILPELQQGSSDRVHRAEPELVWWTGTVFTIFAPR